jgi:hypothetical protein
MSAGRAGWCAVAVIVASGFFMSALRVDVDYATSPPNMVHKLFGPDIVTFAHPRWLSLHTWVRKAYSVVAFACVGFTAHRALGPTTRPRGRMAALVAFYSLAIEIAQHQLIGPEPLAESAFDVGCGAVGGWLAIVLDEAITAKSRAALAQLQTRGDGGFVA